MKSLKYTKDRWNIKCKWIIQLGICHFDEFYVLPPDFLLRLHAILTYLCCIWVFVERIKAIKRNLVPVPRKRQQSTIFQNRQTTIYDYECECVYCAWGMIEVIKKISHEIPFCQKKNCSSSLFYSFMVQFVSSSFLRHSRKNIIFETEKNEHFVLNCPSHAINKLDRIPHICRNMHMYTSNNACWNHF